MIYANPKDNQEPLGTVTFLETTADLGILITAPTLNDLFAQAALAMFGLLTNLALIGISLEHRITMEAESVDFLMVHWLNQLLYLFDGEGIVFKTFSCTVADTTLSACCCGEPLDVQRHEMGEGIKAATYHRLRVEPTAVGWEAEIIFDV